jgi:hypothetical protein
VTTRRLWALTALERGRRRRQRRWLLPLLLAAALLLLVRAFGTAAWLAGAWAAAGQVVLGAPWRLLWRTETSILGRLPIDGAVIYRLQALLSARAAAQGALVLAVAAVPLVLQREGRVVLAAGALGLLSSVAIAPAATVMGLSLAHWPGLERALRQGVGVSGPSSAWITFGPAAAWFGVGAALVAPARLPWLAGGAALGFGLGLGMARRTLPGVLARYGAERVRLAHVERTEARGLEALWGRLTAGPAGTLYRKNVALLRRRYPADYLLCGAGIIGQWVVALLPGGPERRLRLGAGFGVVVIGGAALLARHLGGPPVEYPRLRRTLPLPPGLYRRAAATYLSWRLLAPLLLGAAPLAIRAAFFP